MSEISFEFKNILHNKKYNDNYQKLKTIKCREERKKLRKIVEYLRQLVFKSTNKIIEI